MPAPPPAPRTVLVAITGLSPAVLTETVWALSREDPPVVPDEIIVLTTTVGRDGLKKPDGKVIPGLTQQLFGEDGLWYELRRQILEATGEPESKLRFSELREHVQVFSIMESGRVRELADLNTLAETEAAADCMVKTLNGLVRHDETTVIASISGGFKSMSALLYSCMSLLGREQDRIVHVLVSHPYDGGVNPPFYWPEQPCQALIGRDDKKTYPAAEAAESLVLAPVQFPPLTLLFRNESISHSSTYSDLVQRCRKATKEAAKVKHIHLQEDGMKVTVDGRSLPLQPRLFYLLWFHLENPDGFSDTAINSGREVSILALEAFLKQKAASCRASANQIGNVRPQDGETYRSTLRYLRSALIEAGLKYFADALPSDRRTSVDPMPAHHKIEAFADTPSNL